MWRLQLVGTKTARNDKFHRPIIDWMTLVHVQLHPQVLKAATTLKTDRGVFGYHMDATISSKAASEKSKTVVSHNRYIYPRIDFFLDGHFITTRVNRKQWVGVIFGTPGTVNLRYSLAVSPSVYTVFSLHLTVRFNLLSDDC